MEIVEERPMEMSMRTVEEMISELQTVKNKKIEVYFYHSGERFYINEWHDDEDGISIYLRSDRDDYDQYVADTD